MMSWVFGIFALIAALLGAILASRAVDLGMLTFGLGLVCFGVLLLFWLIKDHYDQEDRARS
jgi:uncharacterized membrane protein